jgi:hypothetical protein
LQRSIKLISKNVKITLFVKQINFNLNLIVYNSSMPFYTDPKPTDKTVRNGLAIGIRRSKDGTKGTEELLCVVNQDIARANWDTVEAAMAFRDFVPPTTEEWAGWGMGYVPLSQVTEEKDQQEWNSAFGTLSTPIKEDRRRFR